MLVAEGLTKRFEGLVALEDLSARVAPAEVLGIIGPNGAGKTTLINLLTGLFPPTSGRVLVDDRPITGWPMHRIARQGVSRTFQQIRIFRAMTVFDNVAVAVDGFGLRGLLSMVPGPGWRAERAARDRVMELLGFVGLAERSGALAGALPFGQQRRLEIARALALSPRYLLLDEPASGMNEGETESLSEDIEKIRATGRGILLIEHDMSLIRRSCSRVLAMNFGRLLVEGPTEDVVAHPSVVEAYLGT